MKKIKGNRGKRKKHRYKILWGRVFAAGILLLILSIGIILFGRQIYVNLVEISEQDTVSGIEGNSFRQNTEKENTGKALDMENIRVILQNPELPSGCEATAATMLLSAYGIKVDKCDFADALPCISVETDENGNRYGANPEEIFVGSPYEGGYGVFAKPVAKTIQRFIDDAGKTYTARDITGATERTILTCIDKNMPVCIWVTVDLKEIQYRSGWYLREGEKYTETYFQWPGGEHCMLLVGYNKDQVRVMDPLKGEKTYDLKTFFQRYKELGSYAVIIETE